MAASISLGSGEAYFIVSGNHGASSYEFSSSMHNYIDEDCHGFTAQLGCHGRRQRQRGWGHSYSFPACRRWNWRSAVHVLMLSTLNSEVKSFLSLAATSNVHGCFLVLDGQLRN
ncbi:hypothetical protein BRADI_2g07932v3 [Brachypodium distachyon]|uniref:Uncharacterized protein n=1 Tax=Brachypodium distachyon TaxID=15368 RepID=A0A2K2D7G6_BRADI|nr:hypothetical protein BRADI_2g07932v3 [Brachypodium distachyon]